MKKFTIVICLLLLTAFCSLNIIAQSPDKTLKKSVKALGGEKVLRNESSKETFGKIKRLSDGAGGDFHSQTLQPNFYTETYDIGGFETAVGFNGKSGWIRDSQNGLRTLTGDAGKGFQAETNYRNNFWLTYKQDKSKISSAGETVINGNPADAVLLTNVKGVSIKIYFDKVTGLPVREEIPQASLINEYSDYKTVDGIQEPFTIISTRGGERYEIKIDSIKHNSAVSKNVFDFPNISNEPLPDIPSLLKQIEANSYKMEAIRENYTYTQTNVMREFKDGVLRDKETETFQVSHYKGREINRLIAKNGKPLAADEQEKEDKKAEKAVEEIDKDVAKKKAEADKQLAAGKSNDSNQDFSISEILSASNLLNPRRESFRGRDVIVFDFEPNTSFDYKNAKSFLKLFGKTAGVMYVDEKDKEVVRLEAVLADNFKVGGGLLANLKKGASFTLENDRINDEVWLPSSADINLSVKLLLVKGININQLIKYGNYEKFNSEVKDSKIDEVKKP